MTDACALWMLDGFSFTAAEGSPPTSFPQILIPGKFADGYRNLSVPERERKGGEGEKGRV